MRSYLEAWDTQREPIEGASQRLHEDTQRFASGLEGCLIVVLDAMFTLAVFSPILLRLGTEVASPIDLGDATDGWLWAFAFLASLIGLSGAAILGQKLVGLEVANQKVEALLRKYAALQRFTPVEDESWPLYDPGQGTARLFRGDAPRRGLRAAATGPLPGVPSINAEEARDARAGPRDGGQWLAGERSPGRGGGGARARGLRGRARRFAAGGPGARVYRKRRGAADGDG